MMRKTGDLASKVSPSFARRIDGLADSLARKAATDRCLRHVAASATHCVSKYS